jgi:hypothetical protein
VSRVYFHSPSGDAELRGSERAWLRHLAEGPALAAWDLDNSGGYDRAVEILAMAPEVPDRGYGENYLHNYLREAQEQEAANRATYKLREPGQPYPGPTSFEPQRRLVQALRTSLQVMGLDLDVAGRRLRSVNVDLNTALVAGSDPVRLAAKIHGWCESHCWVEGPDREWMAVIIDEGLRTGLYRRGLWYADQPEGPKDRWSDQGWEDVLTLLRSRDDEPVVLSYSVTDRFPNQEVAGWTAPDGEDPDAWYEVAAEEQWRLGMAGLRERRAWARLAPDTLTEVTFGEPVTVYDLFAPDRDDRVRAAFAGQGADA